MAWWSREKESKKKTASKKSVPSGLFQKCEECGATVETEKVHKNWWCCPHCGWHFILPTDQRIKLIVDENSFREEDALIQPEDPLHFRDSKRYADRIRAAQKQVGVPDAFRAGMATLDGHVVSIGFFVFEFMGGSMGSVVGEKITRLFERALARRCPAVICNASGGARMQEGILSLMQMAKTTAALARLKEAGLPYLSVLLHPTTGGVAASFAMLGDVILAEPKALIGFAGPRVIEQTIRQKLPEGFQRSEFLLEHGMVDLIVERKQLRQRLIELVALLGPQLPGSGQRLTYRQALLQLFALRRFGVRPSLDGVGRALDALGHPEREFGVIHIAGTNGKGSTAAFCASLLGAANCRTGLYTSPHLCRFTERIRIDGVEVEPAEVGEWVERLLPPRISIDLTFFELTTAMAFALFRAHHVEVAVVECGLGGRWDATNVVTPLCSVVTGVAMDHVEILGGTLESIAREKAGIFKRGVPAVAACHDPGARQILIEEAARIGAPLSLLQRDFTSYPGPLSMLGAHQADNAALAVQAIARAPARYLASPDAQARALARTHWPGRLEWLGPNILVDGAHNPDGAAALASALPSLLGKRPFTLVAGFVDDKDVPGILGPLVPLASKLILTRPKSPRAFDPSSLPGEQTGSLEEALERAEGLTVICGSLFLVGEARHLLLGQAMDPIVAQDPGARKL